MGKYLGHYRYVPMRSHYGDFEHYFSNFEGTRFVAVLLSADGEIDEAIQ